MIVKSTSRVLVTYIWESLYFRVPPLPWRAFVSCVRGKWPNSNCPTWLKSAVADSCTAALDCFHVTGHRSRAGPLPAAVRRQRRRARNCVKSKALHESRLTRDLLHNRGFFWFRFLKDSPPLKANQCFRKKRDVFTKLPMLSGKKIAAAKVSVDLHGLKSK